MRLDKKECERAVTDFYKQVRKEFSMQKTEFIEHVAKEASVTKSEADKVVRATLRVIEEALSSGDKITLTGFGTFEVRERGERQVTSIRTKEKVTVAASKLPSFSAGSELKAAVNGKLPAKENGAKGSRGRSKKDSGENAQNEG